MTEKLGKNFSSHPRARDESTWWIPGCYWLWRCSELLVLAELHTSAPETGARPAPSLRHLTTFISPSTDCECKNPPCFVTCDVKTFKAKHRKTFSITQLNIALQRDRQLAEWILVHDSGIRIRLVDLPWSPHTDISSTDISLPGSKSQDQDLKVYWTHDCRQQIIIREKSSKCFQFETSPYEKKILEWPRETCQEVVMIVTWVWWQDAQFFISQSKVSVITRRPMRSQSHPRDMWCVTHGRGVTWQGGVTSCDTHSCSVSSVAWTLIGGRMTNTTSDWLIGEWLRGRGLSKIRCEKAEWRSIIWP